jgi:hypothetical protein
VPSKWLETLKEEEVKHNTAPRDGQNCPAVGPAENPKTPITSPSKTSKTPLGLRDRLVELRKNLRTRLDSPSKTSETPDGEPREPIRRTTKTSKTTEAERLGLIATWSSEFGYVSIHDPTTGEWHDLQVKDAPSWAVGEARRRKELYRGGNRKAYRLTSREMEEIWEAEHLASEDEGIVEDRPLEED